MEEDDPPILVQIIQYSSKFSKYDWGERAPGWGHHPGVKTMEWNYERDGDPGAGLGPIGTYDPRFPPQVVPLGKGW